MFVGHLKVCQHLPNKLSCFNDIKANIFYPEMPFVSIALMEMGFISRVYMKLITLIDGCLPIVH